jgi:hypothetical protein
MAFDLGALLGLWSAPLPNSDEEAAERVRELYTDPVTVNGTELTALDLVTRARALQGTFAEAEHEVLDVVETGEKVAVAFRMRGRQVGPYHTTLGALPPTGELLAVRVIDLLTLTEGRISNIWMVADELGMLVSLDAVTWRGNGAPG